MQRMNFRHFLPFVLVGIALAGCSGSSTGKTSDADEPTKSKSGSDDSASGEREKLLAQQLELEKQKTEMERLKAELERQKREQAEADAEKARLERLAAEERAQRERDADKFDTATFNSLRDTIVQQSDALGRQLLSETHPTGTYSHTSTPAVSLSSQRDAITANIMVHWKGGFSETAYSTIYSFRITTKGLERLEVLKDEALIKIDPSFLKSAELSLRRIFDPE